MHGADDRSSVRGYSPRRGIVHSNGRPDGEIRGQIVERTADNFSFALDGSQQVPPDFSAFTGACFADLSNDATQLSVDCAHDVTEATGAHLHRGPAGSNGPIVFDFGDPASPFSGNVPMTPASVADLLSDFLYVNIHSIDSPDGEVRGQLLAGIFTDGFESGDVLVWSSGVP